MSSPWEYFGACDYAEARYSHSVEVVSAAVTYPRSRCDRVLAIIEQQRQLHLLLVAVKLACTLPDDPGGEIISTSSDGSESTDSEMPGLIASSDDEGGPAYGRVWLGSGTTTSTEDDLPERFRTTDRFRPTVIRFPNDTTRSAQIRDCFCRIPPLQVSPPHVGTRSFSLVLYPLEVFTVPGLDPRWPVGR